MTESVDRETVEDIISTLNSIQFFDQVHDVDLSAAAKALRALLAERDRLRVAGQAVVDRWDTPLWKEAEATGHVINQLRAALEGDQT